jgi:small GTP-binding protein
MLQIPFQKKKFRTSLGSKFTKLVHSKSYVSETSYKDQKFSLVFFDTACEEVYDQLRPLCYPEANVFMVCFSVVNMQSFLNVKDKWIPEFQQLLPKVPFILVGTKLDLRE